MPRATKSIFNPLPCISFNMFTSWSLDVARLRCSFDTCSVRSRSGRTVADDAACSGNELRWTFVLSIVFFHIPKIIRRGPKKLPVFDSVPTAGMTVGPSYQVKWKVRAVARRTDAAARQSSGSKSMRGQNGCYPRFSNLHLFSTFHWAWANSNHKPEELVFNLRY